MLKGLHEKLSFVPAINGYPRKKSSEFMDDVLRAHADCHNIENVIDAIEVTQFLSIYLSFYPYTMVGIPLFAMLH